ncbi:lysine-specific histone demethylase 1B-like [Rhincodon typus]|uniref:lysine-specific histone demethylase 1B-like n=1 Tax=Rhincodon typus TaxID=259920 RepID=UPI00202EA831|nr:lysine-specific histone demethylase 1B-like [Rhincodon typus]
MRIGASSGTYAISGRMRAKKRPPIFEGSMDTNPPLRSSGRQVKKKTFETEEEEEGSEKKYRKCEKAGCSATYPVCFASAAERCAKNGYTSRWYHLSCGEHFCNECFDHCYRSHKDGYEKYATWKRIWTSNGKSEPSLKAFMADQLVPYWVQCTKPDCAKWRQLTRDVQMTTASAKTYRCGMKTHTAVKSENSDPCSLSEDMRVSEVGDSKWYSMLIVPPLLKDSPAAPFLGAYYPDCVGMSPSCSNTNRFHNEFSNMKMISSEHSKKNVQSPGKMFLIKLLTINLALSRYPPPDKYGSFEMPVLIDGQNQNLANLGTKSPRFSDRDLEDLMDRLVQIRGVLFLED